jgi:hypothetical protein
MNSHKRNLYQYLIIIFLSIFNFGFANVQKINKTKNKNVEVFLKTRLTIIRYKLGEPVFSDRTYSDHIKIESQWLNNLFLIKIPRHLSSEINFNISKDMTVYRLICKKNLNNFSDWEETTILIAVVGRSCVHNEIVKKEFKAGSYLLKSGGPIASSPIFFKEKK